MTSHLSGWSSSKTQEITNADVNVEKEEPLSTVGRFVNWYSHYEKQYGVSLKN